MEKELWVTSHEYLLKGSPFTWGKLQEGNAVHYNGGELDG